MWGLVPAAGRGSRMQPLAFSKELLPVGSQRIGELERPRAVTEYLLDRMTEGGADRICFIISPGKHDILDYFGSCFGPASLAYVVQSEPRGLCDALFQALPLIADNDEPVLIGLPDTVWFPTDGFRRLASDQLSFLCFPVEQPQFFDAVVADEHGAVQQIQVKQPDPDSHWVWGAFSMPARVFHELARLWREPGRGDEYVGTLVNEYLRRGGRATAVRAGTRYVDTGTLNGYREALTILGVMGPVDAPT